MKLPLASIDSFTFVPLLSVNVQVVLLSWNAAGEAADWTDMEHATIAAAAVMDIVKRIGILPLFGRARFTIFNDSGANRQF